MNSANDLALTLIQADLFWENPKANREQFENIIGALKQPTDVIILPEMFATGFSMQPQKLGESMQGTTVQWMRRMAEQVQAVVVGSAIIHEKGFYFNRLLWMQPDGSFEQYDKRHLFRMAGEHEIYAAGDKRRIVEIKGWKVLPLICYDLRFPVWSRNCNNEYDLILYIANWPERRIAQWDILLKARAVENQSYVAAVNRVGNDGKGIRHPGHSAVIDYIGRTVCSLGEGVQTQTLTLRKAEQDDFRQKFPVWKDADRLLTT